MTKHQTTSMVTEAKITPNRAGGYTIEANINGRPREAQNVWPDQIVNALVDCNCIATTGQILRLWDPVNAAHVAFVTIPTTTGKWTVMIDEIVGLFEKSDGDKLVAYLFGRYGYMFF